MRQQGPQQQSLHNYKGNLNQRKNESKPTENSFIIFEKIPDAILRHIF